MMSQNHQYAAQLIQEDVRYHVLYAEHAKLEDELQELKKHPAVDATEIRALKRKKLKVVDELERLRKISAQRLN